jgi:hypothetical protein
MRDSRSADLTVVDYELAAEEEQTIYHGRHHDTLLVAIRTKLFDV